MSVVPVVRTKVSAPEIEAAIGRAHVRVMGTQASPSFVKTLAAQAALETAHGQSMMNYNFGGIKGTSPEGMSARYRTFEVEHGNRVDITDGFRAYSSIQSGADDFVKTIAHRFPAAFRAAEHGDIDGYAHALKKSGYYTANEADYRNLLQQIAGPSHATTHAPVEPPSVTPPPEWLDANALARVELALEQTAADRLAAPI